MSKDHNHGEGFLEVARGFGVYVNEGGTLREAEFAPPVPGVAPSSMPEFLPVAERSFARVSEVDVVNIQTLRIEFYLRSGATCYANAPYFGAWLDRLGIPWTEELRRAHEAATKEGGST